MKIRPIALALLLLTSAATILPARNAEAWTPKKAPLMTKWADKVDPKNPLPEYPRPQMVRGEWRNLNGVWEYQSGHAGDAAPTGQKLSGEILVPFPVESALSGVMEHHDRLWYRRTFTVPARWKNRRVMLHFGAVDYEAEVFVNGKSVGGHQGGYESFSYDVTPFLKNNDPQELIVRVFDPTETGGQPRGKQTTKPGGIMYTPTTGIWQTVWLEPVTEGAIDNLKIVPDVDKSQVQITVNAPGAAAGTTARIKVKMGGKIVRTVTTRPNRLVTIPLAHPQLWTPDHPNLYTLSVALVQGNTVQDVVGSYFGMRKISVGTSSGGVPKMLLNNKFVFQIGPLDQGFWPDGIYTAPTDDALKFDIEQEKNFGFNMVRKHIKIEPARWYYWADKLGILVWQDMPSPNSYIENPPPMDQAAFEKEVRTVIPMLGNHPSIIMWVIFNEGQGRHDTAALVNLAKTLDPTRLVNRDSGAGYETNADGDVGHVDDVHSYPPPASPPPSATQALACGEYGGIGFIIKGHTWKSEGWGYTTINSARELEDLYGEFTGMLKEFHDKNGLSAAVYTEITDVEIESNGLMTYDRILKCDPARIRLANRFQYPVPSYNTILPTSQETEQTWKYTFTTPAETWTKTDFDDAGWQTGPGGFGTAGTPGIGKLGTVWNTGDIYLRRTFDPGDLTPEQIERLVVRDYHDEDVEIYLNGVLAYKAGGYISRYENIAISDAAKKAIVPGGENVLAVHCHQTQGGQFIDVGLFERLPAEP